MKAIIILLSILFLMLGYLFWDANREKLHRSTAIDIEEIDRPEITNGGTNAY